MDRNTRRQWILPLPGMQITCCFQLKIKASLRNENKMECLSDSFSSTTNCCLSLRSSGQLTVDSCSIPFVDKIENNHTRNAVFQLELRHFRNYYFLIVPKGLLNCPLSTVHCPLSTVVNNNLRRCAAARRGFAEPPWQAGKIERERGGWPLSLLKEIPALYANV